MSPNRREVLRSLTAVTVDTDVALAGCVSTDDDSTGPSSLARAANVSSVSDSVVELPSALVVPGFQAWVGSSSSVTVLASGEQLGGTLASITERLVVLVREAISEEVR